MHCVLVNASFYTSSYHLMLATNEIPFVSSLHGRERRTQRNISARDLKSAIKYGQKEVQYRNGVKRWKYTFADVVYITDETSTIEVTSYAVELPLEPVILTSRIKDQVNEARRRVISNPSSITSHTVLLVDMSASMGKSDMNGHKSRSRGVHYFLAENFIANRLYPVEHDKIGGESLSFTDVVTLIEMRESATVVFECEPISWDLYNRFHELREESNTREHGNYFNAFQEAFYLLAKYDHNKCAACLFFFSDGAPSDFYQQSYRCGKGKLKYLDAAFPDNLMDLITSASMKYRDRLTFNAFGFGKNAKDFQIMKDIISVAEKQGSKCQFGYDHSDCSRLSTLMTDTALSLTATRTLLTRLPAENDPGDLVGRVKVAADKEAFSSGIKSDGWTIFTGSHVDKVSLQYREQADGRWVSDWESVRLANPAAVGFAVRKKFFSEGAERIVFQMTEINAKYEAVGMPLVAKISLYKHKQMDGKFLERWHRRFAITQREAAKLARKFSNKMDSLGLDRRIPRVTFLSCSIYNAQDGSVNHSYLAEKQLDPSRYMKWNNNCGGVDGNAQVNVIPYENIDYYHPDSRKLDVLKEEEEEEEEEDGDLSDAETVVAGGKPSGDLMAASGKTMSLQDRVLDADIPQAFSHWTHRFTKRTRLVCDLQGQLSLDDRYPVFELTDPCIHSTSGKWFGRTDRGFRGVQDFFNTHQCNHLCNILGIANDSYRP